MITVAAAALDASPAMKEIIQRRSRELDLDFDSLYGTASDKVRTFQQRFDASRAAL